ncbi:MAG TPA: TonB family protein [Pyrinomonadaceae bacterium]|nr:TonB family protein [Pyrinomonadaceae bacterium]
MRRSSLQISILTLVVILVSAGILFGQSDADAAEQKIKGVPSVTLPDAAKMEFLYGTMLAEVKVDDTGEVKEVTQIVGPDWTCPNYESRGLTVLRDYIRAQAKKVTFEPVSKDEKPDSPLHWVEFKFTAPEEKGSDVVGARLVPVRTVKGGVLNGTALKLAKPTYPAAARAVRASGTVDITVLISEKGDVISAEVTSGHPLLRHSARTAACTSKFSPTLLERRPVKVSGIIHYTFVL